MTPFLTSLVWKVGAGAISFSSLIALIKWALRRRDRAQLADRAITQIDLLATNHFPHMQESLAQHTRQLDAQTALLTSMDKNIALLVDRFPRQ